MSFSILFFKLRPILSFAHKHRHYQQQTVTLLVRWSWSLLTQRDFFTCLSVCSNGRKRRDTFTSIYFLPLNIDMITAEHNVQTCIHFFLLFDSLSVSLKCISHLFLHRNNKIVRPHRSFPFDTFTYSSHSWCIYLL